MNCSFISGRRNGQITIRAVDRHLFISKKCKSCAVGIDQEKWDQDDESNLEYIIGDPSDEINQEYNYLSNLHYRDTFVSGKYYETQVCVTGDLNCGNNF